MPYGGAAVAVLPARGQWRDPRTLLDSWAATGWLPLALVVIEGYLAITSSRNQGTAAHCRRLDLWWRSARS
jgi:hypothetical protein